MLYNPDGSLLSDKPVHVVARINGVRPRQVPALILAWQDMGAIVPRIGGGWIVRRIVAAGDPEALRRARATPHAKPRMAGYGR